MRAGFAEIDITPPVGIHKIGWIMDIISDRVLDPLHARVAVFENRGERLAFIQLDTLSIRWTQVNDIRGRIERSFGFPGSHVMVAATHNHAGPAVSTVGLVPRDDAYVETLVGKCVEAFGAACASMQEAEVGFAHVFEFAVAHNRRVVMRDGTARTHGTFADPDALCIEGPIDPEVAVLAVRAKPRAGNNAGALLGCIVNFSCHPTHHGDDTSITAGYPGVLAAEMKSRGCPVAVFLNGASGNTHTAIPATASDVSMDEAGRRLAADAQRAIESMKFADDLRLAAASATLQLPYRRPAPAEIAGTIRGAQRFVDPSWYDRSMPALLERIRTRRLQPAEVQVLAVGNVAFAGIPAEYFVEHGLRIKEQSAWPPHPVHALVVGHANGMIGYVPTRQAFERGGYETTFAPSSRMAPETGDMLADAAIELVKGISEMRGGVNAV